MVRSARMTQMAILARYITPLAPADPRARPRILPQRRNISLKPMPGKDSGVAAASASTAKPLGPDPKRPPPLSPSPPGSPRPRHGPSCTRAASDIARRRSRQTGPNRTQIAIREQADGNPESISRHEPLPAVRADDLEAPVAVRRHVKPAIGECVKVPVAAARSPRQPAGQREDGRLQLQREMDAEQIGGDGAYADPQQRVAGR